MFKWRGQLLHARTLHKAETSLQALMKKYWQWLLVERGKLFPLLSSEIHQKILQLYIYFPDFYQYLIKIFIILKNFDTNTEEF